MAAIMINLYESLHKLDQIKKKTFKPQSKSKVRYQNSNMADNSRWRPKVVLRIQGILLYT